MPRHRPLLYLALAATFALAWWLGRRAGGPPAEVTRVYDVRDLAMGPPPDYLNAPRLGAPAPAPGRAPAPGQLTATLGPAGRFADRFAGGPATRPTAEAALQELAALLRATVAPASWDAPGRTLKPLDGHLVVTHQPDVHREIERVLTDLRASVQTQVTIEVRLIQLTPAAAAGLPREARALLDARLPSSRPIEVAPAVTAPTTGPTTSPTTHPIFLSNAEVNALLNAAQVGQSTTTLTAPRLTLYAGQQAYVMVATQRSYVAAVDVVVAPDGRATHAPRIEVAESGMVLEARAVPAADRSAVTVTLRPQFCELLRLEPAGTHRYPDGGSVALQRPVLREQSFELTALIPDGQTLVIPGLRAVPATSLPARDPAATECLMLVKPTVVRPTTRPQTVWLRGP